MTPLKRFFRALALAFFVIAVAVLLAGADWPPPLGFVWVLVLVFVCAMAIQRRFPIYVHWIQQKTLGRWVRCTLDGAWMGLLMAVVLMLLPRTGGRSATVLQFVDCAIWLGVLMGVGVVCSWMVYVVSFLWARGDASIDCQ